MNNYSIIICLLTLVMAACKPESEPSPNNGEQIGDTIVKKYLVKEYYSDPDSPIREFFWSDDFSRILHITTFKDTEYQLDYDFEYFGNDSMQVIITKPTDSWALALFTNYTCQFDEYGRIDKIDYYINSEHQSTQEYSYDFDGRLISVKDEFHNVGIRFKWEGKNVVATYRIPSGEQQNKFEGFTEYLHPECNIPILLPDGDSYHFWYLTEPLWQNWYNEFSNMQVECDNDGYVICSYRINEQGERYGVTNYVFNQ